ncbi:CASTOR/POLLUX-related putative ion channel [Rhodoluna limnophila]|uniref:CASTOR/POLLUX-related putative ion channel n=1 Tax=Rhodoluna limnophila TaxID=232537 RepID=UPI0011073629|nr:hypothetical protein [Rhodoluna limnophila]
MASISKFGNRALKRGGHSLILGWSPVAIEVIKELTIANENVRKPRIVVLSQTAPAEVESALAGLDLGRQKFQIIQGDPTSAKDLEVANAAGAKSIIDLSSKLEYLEDLINAHAAQHPALRVAIEEILSFEGEEIYFNELPALFGKTYADAVLAFNTASVIGAVIDGEPVINPAADQALPHGSQIIALAEDDDQVIYTGIREDALAKLDLSQAQVLPALVQKHTDATVPVANLQAKLLAQISENSDLLSVFDGLFAAQGASIGLLPVANFAPVGQAIELADVAVAGISKGYSVIGYFDAASGGVALNPPKNARITPAAGDALVVVGTFAA